MSSSCCWARSRPRVMSIGGSGSTAWRGGGCGRSRGVRRRSRRPAASRSDVGGAEQAARPGLRGERVMQKSLPHWLERLHGGWTFLPLVHSLCARGRRPPLLVPLPRRREARCSLAPPGRRRRSLPSRARRPDGVVALTRTRNVVPTRSASSGYALRPAESGFRCRSPMSQRRHSRQYRWARRSTSPCSALDTRPCRAGTRYRRRRDVAAGAGRGSSAVAAEAALRLKLAAFAAVTTTSRPWSLCLAGGSDTRVVPVGARKIDPARARRVADRRRPGRKPVGELVDVPGPRGQRRAFPTSCLDMVGRLAFAGGSAAERSATPRPTSQFGRPAPVPYACTSGGGDDLVGRQGALLF